VNESEGSVYNILREKGDVNESARRCGWRGRWKADCFLFG
jgi:hypothetical protein